MKQTPTDSEYETLTAVARQRHGSWELVSEGEVRSCVAHGWLRRDGNRTALTYRGRAAMDRYDRVRDPVLSANENALV